jgi:glycosyltransferase involved in cell wall biosynthesis
MNILEVVEAWSAGVGRHVRSLCEGLVAEGHRVTVAYSPNRADRACRRFVIDRRKDIRFVPLEMRREISPASDLRSVVELLRLMKSEGPFDVVHGHSSKGGAIARIAGRWSGTPTVYTPNGLIASDPDVSRAKAAVYTLIERVLGHSATSKVVAVSEGERGLILRLRLAPKKRIALVENGIGDEDFEYFSEVPTHHDDLSREPLTFGSIVRFSAQKAPGCLIEAFIRLSKALPQVPMKLVIAGDGELFAQAKRQVEASGLGDRISLLGWRDDTKDVLRAFDVFVLPSLWEGFSYAILEAMAAKLPIVSTDVFGAEETVSRVPGNIVVPAGDPVALATGMKRMATLTDTGSLRQAIRRIGRANHDYARVRFRQSKNTCLHLRVYESCIKRGGPCS